MRSASGPSVRGADRVSARSSADWLRPLSDGAGSSGCPSQSRSLSYLLIKGTPESRMPDAEHRPFDWAGFTAFIIAMVAVNIVIGQGSALGWLSPM